MVGGLPQARGVGEGQCDGESIEVTGAWQLRLLKGTVRKCLKNCVDSASSILSVLAAPILGLVNALVRLGKQPSHLPASGLAIRMRDGSFDRYPDSQCRRRASRALCRAVVADESLCSHLVCAVSFSLFCELESVCATKVGFTGCRVPRYHAIKSASFIWCHECVLLVSLANDKCFPFYLLFYARR